MTSPLAVFSVRFERANAFQFAPSVMVNATGPPSRFGSRIDSRLQVGTCCSARAQIRIELRPG